MKVPTTLEELEKLIEDGIEENMNLEYKSAEALKDVKEISKDVSAMANSDGGIIIYGVKEFDDKERKHKPEKISPINRLDFSKERLEHLIKDNISPKLDTLRIHPIPISETEVVYVVEIPQSFTAHQNTKDHRYYRRYNFESVPMLDYEIKDIMNRSKNPIIDLDFEFSKELRFRKFSDGTSGDVDTINLKIYLVNSGIVMARYINYYLMLPYEILDLKDFEDILIKKYYGDNMINGSFIPILPGIKKLSMEVDINYVVKFDDRQISWNIYADNANTRSGKIKLNEIKLIDNLPSDF